MQVLNGNSHDIGGLTVRRLLPNAARRSIGPFVFFDHIGPHAFAPGTGVDVRPHPHIGLATVTFLFEGVLRHRDSLGEVQDIRPGDINWMTAGSGIVHSERTPEPERAAGHRLHGIQTWLALPRAHERTPPAFHHHPAVSLPVVEGDGTRIVLIAGHGFGCRAPVHVFGDTLYAWIRMDAGAGLTLPAEHVERAVFPLNGELDLVDGDGQAVALGLNQIAVVDPDTTPMIRAKGKADLMLLGGEPLDAPRAMWWNFVASKRELIEEAKRAWEDGAFPSVPGETEFIPLPRA